MNPRFVMGTVLRVCVEAEADSPAAREAFLSTVHGLEDSLSFYRADSDVARINRDAARGPVVVGECAFRAISLALRFSALTDGAFDPTFRSRGGGRFGAVTLDESSASVRFEDSGMVLDLGGIGKGFALDRALARVRARFEVSGVVADFGGQWLFWRAPGLPVDETVLVEDPRREGDVLARLRVQGNASVSTSSQGQRPGHLVESRGGIAATCCLSATAVAPTGAEAEALSTALFVAGPGRAPQILVRFPRARAVLR